LALHDLIADGDAVVAVLSSDLPSLPFSEELGQTQRLGKPLLLLTRPRVERLIGLPDAATTQRVAMTSNEATQAATQAATHVALASFLVDP
jgi:hypothetical protein